MKKISIYKGQKIETNKNGTCFVKDILPNGRFLVEFEDGYQKVTTRKSIRDREIKNPYYPNLLGFGFVGEGIYKCYDGSKITKEYLAWSGMIYRCFSDHEKYYNSYSDCAVDIRWSNLQVFGEWYNKQPFKGNDYQVDKDLLFPGNRIYSPENCVLLPKAINSALSGLLKNSKGFNYNEDTGRFQVTFFDLQSQKYSCKSFKRAEDAERFYLENRLNKFNQLLDLHRDFIDPKALASLEKFLSKIA